jgi:hypothetical protein
MEGTHDFNPAAETDDENRTVNFACTDGLVKTSKTLFQPEIYSAECDVVSGVKDKLLTT